MLVYHGTIPDEFLRFVTDEGTRAELVGQDLTTVPKWIEKLTGLTKLDLSGNQITAVPDWIGKLTALTKLRLDDNQITALPDTLGNLTTLTTLSLYSNQLTALPDCIGNLTALTELRLDDNQITALPDWIGNLTALTMLALFGNQLTAVPDTLGNLTALTELYLYGNKLTSVPDTLGKLTALTTLFLSSNKLTALPDTLGDLTALTTLSLYNNQLTALPDTLGNLTTLTMLHLFGNQLTAVPDWIGNLSALTELDLAANPFTAVPDWIGNLTALTRLDLSCNQITALPDWIGNLTALTEVYLNDNQITALPDWIGNLTALRLLDLSRNELVALPISLADLLVRGLELKLADNPLADPLPQLTERGAESLTAYLRSLKDATPQYEAKLLLVGEGSVGKTSLVAALRGEPFQDKRDTTHGIEVWPLTFPHPVLDEEVTLRSWDFGGQMVYRVTHQFFYGRRALYVVVWNARKGHEQDEVEGWLRRIRLRVEADARVVVVATHCAERRPELDYRQLDHDFPGMLAGHFEVDNRTGDGIPELRKAIAAEAAQLPQMGQLISPRWVAARGEILALAVAEPQIRYEQFTRICEQHEMTEPETLALAQLMHDLGQVIYYGGDDGLKDVVVLNPEWLTKAISYVLEDKPTRDKGGILDHARLRTVWHDDLDQAGYPARYHPYFLRLMEKFDVSYRLDSDESHSLVAQLVPHERPELPWQRDTPLNTGSRRLDLVCQLAEPAPGLIPWLTVRHHRASAGLHWRRGLFLRHPIAAYASEALLELDSAGELMLEVRAPSPDLYFNVLRDSIENLVRTRWPGLDYELLIPCPTILASGNKCPGRMQIVGLLKLREIGHSSYPCIRCAETHDISLLITGFATTEQTYAASMRQISDQLDRIEDGVLRTEGLAAESAETVRRVLRAVSAEVTDCPTLVSLTENGQGLGRKLRFHQRHYRLTLWCEHPGHWHRWPDASYDIDPPTEWFAKVSPYLKLIFKTLQILVPLAGSIAVASLPADQIESANAHLDLMRTVIDDLPSESHDPLGEADLGEPDERRRRAEGEALRAIRAIVFDKDTLRAFGGLRRVQDPAGDFLWVCKNHYPEYDPGLPRLP
jgi:internalin A